MFIIRDTFLRIKSFRDPKPEIQWMCECISEASNKVNLRFLTKSQIKDFPSNSNCFSLVITGIRCNFVPTTEVLIPSRWHSYCIPVAGIACFKCVSVNGDNPSCEDRFHNNATAGIVELVSPCMAGRKGRDGLFPASDCIKVTGVYGEDRFQLLKDFVFLSITKAPQVPGNYCISWRQDSVEWSAS